MIDTDDFPSYFQALSSHQPLKWQHRLFNRLVSGVVPGSVTLPTGLGKTSIIPIWLIALAQSARANDGPPLPRRLVYVVNRRTVVDQATDDAKRLLGQIYQSGRRDNLSWALDDDLLVRLGLAHRASPDAQASSPAAAKPAIAFHNPLADTSAPVIKQLRIALDGLCTGDAPKCGLAVPVAVSTLRGELADNGEWKQNPARPAIIIGTVDMIGSKLLFSGYGDGRYGRAHHAGLIGQDALIVHDEAHLSPAFSKLLRTVEEEQGREFGRAGQLANSTRPIRVMELSATTRRDGANGGPRSCHVADSFGIESEDADDRAVQQRLTATKRLSFVELEAGKKDALTDAIAERAFQHDADKCRLLVYVRSPEAAASVRDALAHKLIDAAKKAGSRFSKDEALKRVGLLTGTIRGYERDQLAASDLFKAFKSDPERPLQLAHTLYLVSTSAGEVGADWDADHFVCDLTTLDSMAQRLGRVNRLGVGKDGKPRTARITVVGQAPADKDPLKSQLTKTRACLALLPELLREPEDGGTGPVRDASPKALSEAFFGAGAPHKQVAVGAISPAPTILPATDILFDHWSLTSIGLVKGADGRWRDALPGRSAVEDYLHGAADWEPPETYVAWRADISLLAKAGGRDDNGADVPCSTGELEQVFDAFPLRSAEQLRDQTTRVQEQLRNIATRLRKEAERRASSSSADTESEESSATSDEDGGGTEAGKEKGKPIEPNPWVVRIRRGEPAWVRLEDIAPADNDKAKTALRDLDFATVVLPAEVGGLKGGMLDGDEPARQDAKSLDVAEMTGAGQRSRQRALVRADETEDALLTGAIDDSMPTKERLTLRPGRDDEDEPTGSAIGAIEYRVQKGDAGEPGRAVCLHDHNAAVAAAARRIATALGLPDDLIRALESAGRGHDAGKSRGVWQWYARNANPAKPLAKNKRYRDPRSLRGYRHEFGSLHDAAADDEVRLLDSDARDLVLHLIAAHHGWARPHFEPRHFDCGDPGKPRATAENERLAVEAMQSFARLQQRYGRWGLAWLESILRCADAEASASAAQSEPSRDREGAGSVGGTGVPPVTVAADNGGGVA